MVLLITSYLEINKCNKKLPKERPFLATFIYFIDFINFICYYGEIYFDNVLIRKDGIFVHPDLVNLNPENFI